MKLCSPGAYSLVRDVRFFISKRGGKNQRLAVQKESQRVSVLVQGSLEKQNQLEIYLDLCLYLSISL